MDAKAHGIRLSVVKLPEAKKGFVLLPKRWVVEYSFGWMSRFRRLARDYERLTETLVTKLVMISRNGYSSAATLCGSHETV
jgi:transposase